MLLTVFIKWLKKPWKDSLIYYFRRLDNCVDIKICGGELEIIGGTSVCESEYCGSKRSFEKYIRGGITHGNF